MDDVSALHMREVKTADGSVTFHNESYDEDYHSKSGAVEEAFEKYVCAVDYGAYARRGRVRILDVCFGLGYNTAAALDRIWSVNPDCFVEVVGLENDPEILSKTLEVSPAIKSYDVIKRAVLNSNKLIEPRVDLKIILGDARVEIEKLSGRFDLVFHDPFSLKKCPELWTLEFFSSERKLIADDGVLLTYSCARVVRDNLEKSGFKVLDGPSVGRRAPSTIARP